MKRQDTKRTIFTFLPYECAAAEKYLELMAEKGWLLQSVKGIFYKFKKIEPKNIKYSVDILHKVSIFDHKDSDAALEYREYCKAAGWNYVCEIGKIQIFYTNDDKKTISIHTDEEEKFKAIFKVSLYNSGSQIFLTLIFIFNIYMQLSMEDGSFALTSNSFIFSLFVMVSLIFINIIGGISFLFWVIKARGELKKHKAMQFNNYKQIRIKNILRKTYGLILLLIFLKLLVYDNLESRGVNISFLIIMCIPIIIMISVQKFINKKRYSKNTNRAITIGSIVVSIYLVLMIVVNSVLLSVPKAPQNKVSNEKISLTLMDFGFKENNDPYIKFDKSIMAQRIYYVSGNGDNYLNYTILQSDYSFVIKLYENRLLSKFNRYGNDLLEESTNLPNNIVAYSDSEKRIFVLVSEDKVVNVRKDFTDISDEQFLNKVYKNVFY